MILFKLLHLARFGINYWSLWFDEFPGFLHWYPLSLNNICHDTSGTSMNTWDAVNEHICVPIFLNEGNHWFKVDHNVLTSIVINVKLLVLYSMCRVFMMGVRLCSYYGNSVNVVGSEVIEVNSRSFWTQVQVVDYMISLFEIKISRKVFVIDFKTRKAHWHTFFCWNSIQLFVAV